MMFEEDLLVLVFCAFFRTFLTSTLSSSAGPCSNFWHAFSIVEMCSSTGGCLGFYDKFWPPGQ